MEHTFEHDGVQVVVRRQTVGDRLTRRTIVRKLRRAYGVDPAQDMNDVLGEDLTDALVEYADVLSESHAPNAAWWANAGDAPETLRAGFECYVKQDAELYDLIASAESAVKPEKKVTANTTKKS